MNPVTQFIEAARFLTRTPLPGTRQTSITLNDAFLMFPVVGIFIGAFTGILLWAAGSIGLPPYLAAVIALGSTIILTGGLHEDGLGDVADGFGGGQTRDSKLDIMRDSRVGSYGVLCLVLSVAARLGALAVFSEQLAPLSVIGILIAGAALSRGAMVGIISFLPPARAQGLSANLSPSLANSGATYLVTLAITTAALMPVLPLLSITITIITSLLAAFILAILALRQIGGHTGDVAGATQQITEIAALFTVVALV